MTTTEIRDVSNLISDFYAHAGLQSVEVGAKRPNKRGEQTRDRLVRAATDCFKEYGYTRTRISDIVHRGGTSQGNFYRHFNSLDEIFLEALRPGLEELAAAGSLRGRVTPDLEALVASQISYLEAYARHRFTLRLLREAAAASPNDGFLQLWLRLRGDFVARTQRWLQRLNDAGTINEPNIELLAESLGCLTEQMAYIHVGLATSTPRRERLEELGRAVGEMWFRALRTADPVD